MSIYLSIFLVILFLFMNAFFVVSEFALVKVRKSQIEIQVEKGSVTAKYAQKITDNLNAYLSACQLGITLASLALGWIGEPAVSHLLEPLIVLFGLPEATTYAVSIAIGFSLVSALHIILGELVPKSLAILSTEKYAMFTAIPLFVFYRITYPIMWLFNSTTNGILKLMGHSLSEEHSAYTKEEIKILMSESFRQGLLQEDRFEVIDNIFDLDDKDAETLMTPRTDMVCLYMEDSMEENMKTVRETNFTRYPVCVEDKDNIIGFVHIKDLYSMKPNSKTQDLKIRTIQAVPESISVSGLVEVFQKQKTKIAVVVDEHGGTAGIVTLSDVFAQIIGHMEDEYIHDEGEDIIELQEGHYLIDGSLPIGEFANLVDLDMDDMMEYETLGGMILGLKDRIPDEGEEAEFDNIHFIVKGMDGRRVKTVEVQVIEKNNNGD